MELYLEQLHTDIAHETANAVFPYIDKGWSLHDWISPEKEDVTAPVRDLEEWTGRLQPWS